MTKIVIKQKYLLNNLHHSNSSYWLSQSNFCPWSCVASLYIQLIPSIKEIKKRLFLKPLYEHVNENGFLWKVQVSKMFFIYLLFKIIPQSQNKWTCEW